MKTPASCSGSFLKTLKKEMTKVITPTGINTHPNELLFSTINRMPVRISSKPSSNVKRDTNGRI
jgi:hypothetical protein